MDHFGNGVYLDEILDLDVDESGDVRGSRGPSELRKDLSFFLIRALETGEGISTPENIADNGVIGEPLTRGTLTDIELASKNVIGADPRIDSVILVSAEESDEDDEFVVLDIETVIDDETESFEFVIPVN